MKEFKIKSKPLAGVVTRDYVHQTTKLAFRKIDGVFFIVDAEKETIHELNAQGSFIWNLIVKKKNREEILKKTSEEFEADVHQAGKDFDEFIDKLKAKGLVRQQGTKAKIPTPEVAAEHRDCNASRDSSGVETR
ncbi:MAG: PqqD family protein [Elusimicrobia bacterium]|nr:PqqD family protein [Elusimicrobiota bacterium]